MPSVLFVCTANRFRSPLAAAAFQKLLKNNDRDLWQVGSAGTWAKNGLPVMPEALQEAVGLGLDLASHRSSLINSEMLAHCDLALVMEAGHREAIQIEFPEWKRKVFMLSEAAGDLAYDIPDPSLLPNQENTHQIALEIWHLVKEGLTKICRLAERLERNAK